MISFLWASHREMLSYDAYLTPHENPLLLPCSPSPWLQWCRLPWQPSQPHTHIKAHVHVLFHRHQHTHVVTSKSWVPLSYFWTRWGCNNVSICALKSYSLIVSTHFSFFILLIFMNRWSIISSSWQLSFSHLDFFHLYPPSELKCIWKERLECTFAWS